MLQIMQYYPTSEVLCNITAATAYYKNKSKFKPEMSFQLFDEILQYTAYAFYHFTLAFNTPTS